MKKIILGMMLFMMACLTACGTTYQEAAGKSKDNPSEDYANGYFTIIVEWADLRTNCYSIVYANDTKVKYLVVESGYRYGITPLYNADGTLQIYEETAD